jgi:nicotinamide-nucleotide amidase
MTAEIIVIGDEILLGLVMDTNSVYISRRLAEQGIAVSRINKVGDRTSEIVRAFEDAARMAKLVICCGGLGPTHDDKTRDAVAEFLGTELALNANALSEIQSMYQKAGRTMNEANRVQAMIPVGANYLSNSRGTAPGITFKKGDTAYFCLQGVPKEMQWMTETYVVPFVRNLGHDKVLKCRTIRTVNVPESTLYDRIRDVVDRFKDKLDMAFLPQMTRGVDIRLTSSGHTEPEAVRLIAEAEEQLVTAIHRSINEAVYGYDDETLEESLARLFFETHQTIATAESCTGGLIAHRLTNVSGSSSYFIQGVTTYSNESKVNLLGVSEQLLVEHGAVSEEVAKAMAENVRKIAGTHLGLSVTGIAGPTGATPTKPVGLAYIGFSTEEETICVKLPMLPYEIDRLTFKERVSQLALDIVRKHLISVSKK